MTQTTTPQPPTAPAQPPRGLLRNGNHQGNPQLAPRCGAKARTTGCPCKGPAMPNGRCRMHGGTATGPRTPQGKARMIAARTKHGRHGAAGAPKRDQQLYFWKLRTRSRLAAEANWLEPYLPPDMAARLAAGPDELWAPVHPSNLPYVQPPAATPCAQRPRARPKPRRPAPTDTPLPVRTREPDRQAARAEAAALKPWRAAIAHARATRKAARAAAPHAQTGQTHPARRNAIRPETQARPTGSPAHQRTAPRLAPTTPRSRAHTTTAQPNPPARPQNRATWKHLSYLTPTKAEALRSTTLAETWHTTRVTLTAQFGQTPPPGWQPPRANPPGWRPPPPHPIALTPQLTTTRPPQRRTP